MAHPSVVARGGGVVTPATTTHTVTVSATPTVGNLLLVAFRNNGSSGGDSQTPVIIPAGWTEITNAAGRMDPWHSPAGFGTTAYVQFFAKVAEAAEPVAVFGTSANQNSTHLWWEISNWSGKFDGIVPVVATASINPPLNNLPTTYGWGNNELLSLAILCWSTSTSTVTTYPTGYGSNTSHNVVNACIASAEKDVVGLSEDPTAFVLSGSGGSTSSLTVLIRNGDTFTPAIRNTQLVEEVAYIGEPGIQLTQFVEEVAYVGEPGITLTQFVLEVAYIESTASNQIRRRQQLAGHNL